MKIPGIKSLLFSTGKQTVGRLSRYSMLGLLLFIFPAMSCGGGSERSTGEPPPTAPTVPNLPDTARTDSARNPQVPPLPDIAPRHTENFSGDRTTTLTPEPPDDATDPIHIIYDGGTIERSPGRVSAIMRLLGQAVRS